MLIVRFLRNVLHDRIPSFLPLRPLLFVDDGVARHLVLTSQKRIAADLNKLGIFISHIIHLKNNFSYPVRLLWLLPGQGDEPCGDDDGGDGGGGATIAGGGGGSPAAEEGGGDGTCFVGLGGDEEVVAAPVAVPAAVALAATARGGGGGGGGVGEELGGGGFGGGCGGGRESNDRKNNYGETKLTVKKWNKKYKGSTQVNMYNLGEIK